MGNCMGKSGVHKHRHPNTTALKYLPKLNELYAVYYIGFITGKLGRCGSLHPFEKSSQMYFNYIKDQFPGTALTVSRFHSPDWLIRIILCPRSFSIGFL